MNFAESAICTPDVGPTTAEVGPPFARVLQDALAGRLFKSAAQTIVYFPTIIAPSVGTMDDKITYKRSEPAVYVKVNIQHTEWVEATRLGRLKLYVDGLLDGIAKIRHSTLSAADSAQRREVIETSAAALERQWAS